MEKEVCYDFIRWLLSDACASHKKHTESVLEEISRDPTLAFFVGLKAALAESSGPNSAELIMGILLGVALAADSGADEGREGSVKGFLAKTKGAPSNVADIRDAPGFAQRAKP